MSWTINITTIEGSNKKENKHLSENIVLISSCNYWPGDLPEVVGRGGREDSPCMIWCVVTMGYHGLLVLLAQAVHSIGLDKTYPAIKKNNDY